MKSPYNHHKITINKWCALIFQAISGRVCHMLLAQAQLRSECHPAHGGLGLVGLGGLEVGIKPVGSPTWTLSTLAPMNCQVLMVQKYVQSNWSQSNSNIGNGQKSWRKNTKRCIIKFEAFPQLGQMLETPLKNLNTLQDLIFGWLVDTPRIKLPVELVGDVPFASPSYLPKRDGESQFFAYNCIIGLSDYPTMYWCQSQGKIIILTTYEP